MSKTAAKGVQLTEAANINKSLLTLGKVIKKLSKAKNKRMLKHVPFRESKLTRLLQTSLGGNAKTCILCACSPAAYNREETRSTLQFASRAASIENKAKINEISFGDPTQMMKKQKEEIDRLKRMLQGVNVAMVQQSARLEQMKIMATDGVRGGLSKDEAMQRILLAVEDAESAAQPLSNLIRFSPVDSASIGRASRIESDLDLTDYDALGVIGTPMMSQPAGIMSTVGEVDLGELCFSRCICMQSHMSLAHLSIRLKERPLQLQLLWPRFILRSLCLFTRAHVRRLPEPSWRHARGEVSCRILDGQSLHLRSVPQNANQTRTLPCDRKNLKGAIRLPLSCAE